MQDLTDWVARDWVDLRDLIYQPDLSPLPKELYPDIRLFQPDEEERRLVFGIRNQGQSGHCVGFAMANAIDIQRRLCEVDLNSLGNFRTNEEMLYWMSRFHDQFTLHSRGGQEEVNYENTVNLDYAPETVGVRSLRSVVKAFYHHGAMTDDGTDALLRWQKHQKIPNVAQTKAARKNSLGAYYRIKPYLNNYHAALNETGAILVSATLHQGWSPISVVQNGGVIRWTGETGEGGKHAFVIVGYTQEGFLVLNSWGAQWGGYKGLRGIALWTYTDWAKNITDGWLMRLGVPTPEAFDVSIGEQGLANAYGPIRTGSPPCLELMGHYVHLDDGKFVEYSPYPTTPEIIDMTLKRLPESLARGCSYGQGSDRSTATNDEIQPCKGVIIWVSSAMMGLKEAFSRAVARKTPCYDLGCYPLNVFWCNDFVEESIEFLMNAFSKTVELSGPSAKHRDLLIENSVRGTGRAFWREVQSCARKAVWGEENPFLSEELRTWEYRGEKDSYSKLGHFGQLITRLYNSIYSLDCKIHLVAEGAGALVIHEMFKLANKMPEGEDERLFDKIATLNLTLPAIDYASAEPTILRFMERTNAKAISNGTFNENKPCNIFIPDPDLERRLRNGEYRKSILYLISNAFETRHEANDPFAFSRVLDDMPTAKDTGRITVPTPRLMLGMHDAEKAWIQSSIHSPESSPFFKLQYRKELSQGSEYVEQKALNLDPFMSEEIFKSIAKYGGPAILP